MRIAVLRNPASTRNRGRAAPEMPAGVLLHEPETLEALTGALAALAGEGLDLLVVDGGDGTVREVVSRLPGAFGGAPPALGILAHGNTNLVARKLGRIGGYAALATLAARGGEVAAREVPVLRVEGLQAGPMRGFIAGWGAYAAGTQIAIDEIAARGGGQVVRAILATLRRTLIGAGGRALRAGIEARVAPSGHAEHQGRRFAGVATVLEGSLVAGIRPFWGAGSGAIRWLDVAAPPRRLWLAAPLVALGRPMGWMIRAGYRSGRSDTMEITLSDSIVIDGELFETGPDTALHLSARDKLRIVAA